MTLPSAPLRRVLLIDPALDGRPGHHLDTALNYARLFRARGRDIVLCTGRGAPAAALEASGRVRALFRYSIHDAYRMTRHGRRWVGNPGLARAMALLRVAVPHGSGGAPGPASGAPIALATLFAGHAAERGLARLWDLERPARGDDIVILNMDPALLYAVAERIRADQGRTGPRWHLIFQYPEDGFLTERTWVGYAATLRALGQAPAGQVFLYTQIRAHAAALAGHVGRPLTPIVMPTHAGLGEPGAPPPSAGPFIVVAPGAGRLDKGYLRLPAILKALEDVAGPDGIRLVAQAGRGGPALAQTNAALRAHRSARLLSGDLPAEAFGRLVREAHVVLMPYERENYRVRGSGVLIAALLEGRPLICTRGTALEEGLRWGNGLAAGSDREFAEAILAVRKGYAPFAAGARRAADAVRQDVLNSPLLAHVLDDAT